MSFYDVPLHSAPGGKKITDLLVSQSAPMTLNVTTGSVYTQISGAEYFLVTPESHTFVADPTGLTRVAMGMITNGNSADLWVDVFVDDGKTMQADPPIGYEFLAELAWFVIPAGETDLNNVIMFRRVWL